MELRERGVGGGRRDEPAKRPQLPDGVRGPDDQECALRRARQECSDLGDVCCGIAASQRASQAHLISGHRHERDLHQGGERQLRERAGGVRQVPRRPECCGGFRPSSEGGESGRRREAGPVGADTMGVAQEPGELDGKERPEVGIDGPGTCAFFGWVRWWAADGILGRLPDSSGSPRAEPTNQNRAGLGGGVQPSSGAFEGGLKFKTRVQPASHPAEDEADSYLDHGVERGFR